MCIICADISLKTARSGKNVSAVKLTCTGNNSGGMLLFFQKEVRQRWLQKSCRNRRERKKEKRKKDRKKRRKERKQKKKRKIKKRKKGRKKTERKKKEIAIITAIIIGLFSLIALDMAICTQC